MALEEDDLELDVEAKDGGGSKKLIIIIAVVVLLLGISGAATMLLLGGDEKPAPAEGEEAAAEEAAAIPAGAPMLYLALNPPFVVNFSADADVRFLQVDVQVASRDPALLEKMKEHDPAIRNNLVILFSSQTPEALNTREGKDKLRQQVLEEVKKVMLEVAGSDKIENVYFTNFVMQ